MVIWHARSHRGMCLYFWRGVVADPTPYCTRAWGAATNLAAFGRPVGLASMALSPTCILDAGHKIRYRNSTSPSILIGDGGRRCRHGERRDCYRERGDAGACIGECDLPLAGQQSTLWQKPITTADACAKCSARPPAPSAAAADIADHCARLRRSLLAGTGSRRRCAGAWRNH